MPRKRLKKWIIIIVVVYLAGGVALYLLQDAILFHPVQLNRSHRYDFKEPHRDLSIPIDNVDTLNLVQFQHQGDSAKGVVLYFHGNKGSLRRWGVIASAFTKYGYNVLVMDYRGFGKSTGDVSELSLQNDARFFYKELQQQFPEDQIIVYGRSLGTHFAALVVFVEHSRYPEGLRLLSWPASLLSAASESLRSSPQTPQAPAHVQYR